MKGHGTKFGRKKEEASVRVRAAECVMNHSSKAIEIEDIEARVTDLERAAEASKQHR